MPFLVKLIGIATLAALASCATPGGDAGRTATLQRTAHGVAHISAPDFETLAYGVAYAHAQDNVCQTAQQLVTIRGQRSATFGPTARGLLGLRPLPNEQVDLFIAAHMDDAALERAWRTQASADAMALARGYVAGYNRYLADHVGKLPAACNGRAWVKPMTLAEYRRLAELTSVQAGIALLADGVLGAQPPTPRPAGAAPSSDSKTSALPIDADLVAQGLREAGVIDPPFGSNAWAFGRETTADGRGLLLGNPHFPWVGTNRFWQLHVTVPGQLDAMGASLGQTAIVQIGFNKDVAWSHTVSTGKRFTLHELKLVPGDATSYLVDGRPEKMAPQTVSITSRDDSGQPNTKTHTVWRTRYGPVFVMPRAGLTWSAERAYAVQDANAGNARSTDTWLAFNRATRVQDMQRAMGNLGIPWVNTIAADRHGNTMYADLSVVPDIDAATLERCKPSPAAAGLLRSAAGLAVLDGSRGDCNWRRDAGSAVPGLIAAARLPLAIRSDWVQNSNDSYLHTHPAQRFDAAISPLVGDAGVYRGRTRSSHIEIAELLARGKATRATVQQQLFGNRNLAAHAVLPDLLAACERAPTPEARDGCAALRGWDRHNNVESRGAALFREFWRAAAAEPNLWRVARDAARPYTTPEGLRMADEALAGKLWAHLGKAVQTLRTAGYALDVPLGDVQRPAITDEAIALHGGDDLEGVLNNLGARGNPELTKGGLRIDYGTSYVQTVGFDERGPLAQALLTYGQSSDPRSPHATDQLRLFSRKQWPTLPFHPEDVARERVGEVLRLVRP
jgi:acyl-homoserine-lactone acylase